MESPRIAAAKKGAKTYTGKPCKKCGETEKYVVNVTCVACTRKARAADYDKIRSLREQAKAGA